ncbi:MAG: diguanylate cyclase, partial [Chromatocurvus sp.]
LTARIEADPVRFLKSIRSRIVIFAILATLLPSLGLGLMTYRHNQDVIDEKVAYELRSLASHARRELGLWVQERLHDLRSLSSSKVVIDGLTTAVHKQAAKPLEPALGINASNGIGTSGLTQYLQSVHSRLPPLLELTIVDGGGHLIASSNATPTPVPLFDRWAQNATAAGSILTPPHWNAAHDAPTLLIAVPVLSIDNEILGALVAVLDLRAVQPLLKDAGKQLLGEAFLLDAQGRPLLGTQPVAPPMRPLPADILQRLRTQPDQPFAFAGFDQRRVLGMAEIPADQSIVILAQKDRAEVYAAWHRLRNQLFILVGGLSLLVGLLAYRMGRSVVTPLQRLIGASEHIASGNLTVKLPTARDDEIGRLTRVFNQMTDSLRRSRAEIETASQALQEQNQLLARLSVTDSLTGLYNRKKLDEILADQIERYRRNHRSFSVLMLDVDHFKMLNDTHGHLLGDEVLMQIASILGQAIRHVDFVARYGGEEFVVVLVETALQTALEAAERIRVKVAEATYGTPEQRSSATVSIGVAEYRDADANADGVIARADQALYRAKDAGRNRVQSAD